jgi:hypothetical protein
MGNLNLNKLILKVKCVPSWLCLLRKRSFFEHSFHIPEDLKSQVHLCGGPKPRNHIDAIQFRFINSISIK